MKVASSSARRTARQSGLVGRAESPDSTESGVVMALRYAARPAFSEVQLSLREDDVVELELKSPTASGQRVVHLHPVQFLRRLAYP